MAEGPWRRRVVVEEDHAAACGGRGGYHGGRVVARAGGGEAEGRGEARVVLRSRVLARAVSASAGSASSLRHSLGANPHPPPLLASSCRASSVHRLPSVCGGLLSVMSLHSAVVSARLRSAISPESQSWGLVPQVPPMVQSTIRCQVPKTPSKPPTTPSN